jgi:hypothetical protein
MPIQLSRHEQAHWTCAHHQYLGVSGHQICSVGVLRSSTSLQNLPRGPDLRLAINCF